MRKNFLHLFDLDQTIVNSDHRIKFLDNGAQDIDAFRLGNPMQDTLLLGECLDFWKMMPREYKGILTSRVLCNAETRGLINLGLCPRREHTVSLSRPENSPLHCAVLKSLHIARVLRKVHDWRGIVFLDDSVKNLQAVYDTCKTFSVEFVGFHSQGGKAIDWKPETA